jgi:hypothetical protein
MCKHFLTFGMLSSGDGDGDALNPRLRACECECECELLMCIVFLVIIMHYLRFSFDDGSVPVMGIL